MNIENAKKIIQQYNSGINKLENIDETKIVLDILYANKIIRLGKDGKIKKIKNEKVYVGKLQKKEGFGFVLVDGEKDFYVQNVQKYIDGDEVLIIKTIEPGRSTTALILDVINRENAYILVKRNKQGKFEYLQKDLGLKIQIKGLDYEQIKPGTILSVYVKEVKKNKLVTVLNNIIADENDPDKDMKIILDKYNIAVEFSSEVENELKYIEEEISQDERVGRRDLKEQIFFTIDGNDSKDLDDAVSLVKEIDGYTLYVSIADVSHYIKANTKLDEEAKDRATSVYFIDRVVPMLPKKISNGICSLHAGVERLTITCEMKLSLSGEILDVKIYESIIKSKYRMTYKDVNDMIIRKDEKLISKYADIYGILLEMNKLAKKLNAIRIDRGSFNLEDTEAKFKLDSEKNIKNIYPVHREDSEKIIEEFMILANESVTSFASKKESPFIYRVHGHPNPNKLKELKNLLLYLNINVELDYENLDPYDFKQILDAVDEDIFKRALSKMIVRSMQKAVYSTNNIGHFGLASRNYTHFTSPIRRYPDLEVHRILKSLILENKKQRPLHEIEYVCEHSSKKEVMAIKAEQEIEDRKKAEYMKNYIGHFFKGIVTSIEEYGMFLELENTIRGLVRFKDLKNYSDNTPYEVNLFTENKIKLGDSLFVEIVGVNITRGLIDFFPKGYEKNENTDAAKILRNSRNKNHTKQSKGKKNRNLAKSKSGNSYEQSSKYSKSKKHKNKARDKKRKTRNK